MTSYEKYKDKAEKKKVLNSNKELFEKLPNKKYSIIYMDPPWDYGGKMQFDKSSLKRFNSDYEKDIFISSAQFHYPTLKLHELKELDINSIADEDCLIFMWTTGPHLAIAIELGESWGFKYKTMGFIWNKLNHNPGHYTISSTEFVLIFKKGRIPKPRGARNVKQLFEAKRTRHSEKPQEIMERINRMFPEQKKIELFSRRSVKGWDAWGIDLKK